MSPVIETSRRTLRFDISLTKTAATAMPALGSIGEFSLWLAPQQAAGPATVTMFAEGA